ncbi:hypothetical protein K493DRAFT_314902 [Basidiobolus meristosporus CBS 931.73]|uniref:gamma-glutamylcyclotransferase n=1 Tax=Basidiobolus meristosporus CBS 931.73 TaxID=1314790 RepID=A0A1Y1YC52_9FUNG|nr:hypothetical protein K493DRAFT_314902 [Basidiobolus meristosporus CBS 931.73]|eukprot:ORX95631.1 hypothetical protein K493DRAFT_314902 [Basidiobolus meristosporus CBS 931.73]
MAVTESLEEQVPNSVWYLAYGSNMSKAVLTGRRLVKPIKSVPVRVPGYFLSFDHPGMAFVEPGFASVRAFSDNPEDALESKFYPVTRSKRNDAPVVHGVAHLVTAQDFRQIQLTEGGGGSTEFGYQDRIVECVSYTNEKIQAHTLITHDHCARPSIPSMRYLTIIRTGAKEHELDPEFQSYLDDLVAFEAKNWREKVGKFLFTLILIPIFGPMIFLRVFMKKNGELPQVLHWWMHSLGHFIWILHDRIVEPILGNGGSTRLPTKPKSL